MLRRKSEMSESTNLYNELNDWYSLLFCYLANGSLVMCFVRWNTKEEKNAVCKNVTFLRFVAGKHFFLLSLSLFISFLFFFSFTKMVIVYIVMRFRVKRFCFQRFRVTSSWVLRCVLVRWPHHRTELLCLTAASERIKHIIDDVFERNVTFFFVLHHFL